MDRTIRLLQDEFKGPDILKEIGHDLKKVTELYDKTEKNEKIRKYATKLIPDLEKLANDMELNKELFSPAQGWPGSDDTDKYERLLLPIYEALWFMYKDRERLFRFHP
jgi:hypothetical protein